MTKNPHHAWFKTDDGRRQVSVARGWGVGSLYISILCTFAEGAAMNPGRFAPAKPEKSFFGFAGVGELGCWYGRGGRRI